MDRASTGSHDAAGNRLGGGPGKFRDGGPFSATGDSLFVIKRPTGPSRLHLYTLGDVPLVMRTCAAPAGTVALSTYSR